MSNYCVLALDLATVTGWSIWKPGMARPHLGALRLPANPQEVGRPIQALDTLVLDLNKTYGHITDYVFEAQHIGSSNGKMIQIDTIYRLIGLGAHIEWMAHLAGSRCFKAHITQWRKHFIGVGAGKPTAWFKEQAIQRAEEFGLITEVADAAEAFGILDFYVHQIAKADRAITIPWRDKALFKQPGLDL